MKKGRLLDRITTWGIRLAPLIVGNQAVYPEVLNNWAESWQENGVSRINTNNAEIPDLSHSIFDARNYLDLANSTVHQNAVNGAVCRDYTKSTLEVYKKLLKQAGKEDLTYCVRSAFDASLNRGHNWIEILEGGKWIKYETMHKTPNLTKDNVRDYSDSTTFQRTYLNGNPDRQAQVVCDSKSNCHPTLDAYFQKGGNLALLAKACLGG